jgi:hypothetical protein
VEKQNEVGIILLAGGAKAVLAPCLDVDPVFGLFTVHQTVNQNLGNLVSMVDMGNGAVIYNHAI